MGWRMRWACQQRMGAGKAKNAENGPLFAEIEGSPVLPLPERSGPVSETACRRGVVAGSGHTVLGKKFAVLTRRISAPAEPTGRWI